VPATDPSTEGSLVAFHEPGAGGVLVRPGSRQPAPGPHPAVGGGKLAWIGDGTVEVRSQSDGGYVISVPAAADAVAVSEGWAVWRGQDQGRDQLTALQLPPPVTPGGPAPTAAAPRVVATAASGTTLGRPSLAGDRLLFHVAGASRGRIVQLRLTTGARTTLRSAPRTLLLNPSSDGRRLLYVRSTFQRQQLRIGSLRRRSVRRDRSLYGTVPTGRRDAGHEPGPRHDAHGWPRKLPPRPKPGVQVTLWSTALAAGSAYVTRLRQDTDQPVRATLLRVPR
jgi:hypothetical protein